MRDPRWNVPLQDKNPSLSGLDRLSHPKGEGIFWAWKPLIVAKSGQKWDKVVENVIFLIKFALGEKDNHYVYDFLHQRVRK